MSDDAEQIDHTAGKRVSGGSHPVDEVLPFGQELASLSDHQIEAAKRAMLHSLDGCFDLPLGVIKPSRIRAAVEAALRAATA